MPPYRKWVVGVFFASQWVSYFPNDSLSNDVLSMLEKAMLWEQTRILETGKIDSNQNTRTGETQKVNHREVIEAFAYYSSLISNKVWEQLAAFLAGYYYSRDSRLRQNLEAFK